MKPNLRNRLHWIIGHDRQLNHEDRHPTATTVSYRWGCVYALCVLSFLEYPTR